MQRLSLLGLDTNCIIWNDIILFNEAFYASQEELVRNERLLSDPVVLPANTGLVGRSESQLVAKHRHDLVIC